MHTTPNEKKYIGVTSEEKIHQKFHMVDFFDFTVPEKDKEIFNSLVNKMVDELNNEKNN